MAAWYNHLEELLEIADPRPQLGSLKSGLGMQLRHSLVFGESSPGDSNVHLVENHRSKLQVGKLQPLSQIQLLPVFVEKVYWHTTTPIHLVVSMAAFTLLYSGS